MPIDWNKYKYPAGSSSEEEDRNIYGPQGSAYSGLNIPDLSEYGAIPTRQIGREFELAGPDPGTPAMMISALKSEFVGPVVGLAERAKIAKQGTRQKLREEFERDRLNYLAANPSAARAIAAGSFEAVASSLPYIPGASLAGKVGSKLTTLGSLSKHHKPIVRSLAKLAANNPDSIRKISTGIAGAAEGGLIGLGETAGAGPESTLLATGLGILGGGVLAGIASHNPQFISNRGHITSLLDDVITLQRGAQKLFREGGRAPRELWTRWNNHMGFVKEMTLKAQSRIEELDDGIATYLKRTSGDPSAFDEDSIRVMVNAYLKRPGASRQVVLPDGTTKKVPGHIEIDKALPDEVRDIAFNMKVDILKLQSKVLKSPFYTEEFKKIVSASQGRYLHTSFAIKDLSREQQEKLLSAIAEGTDDRYRALRDFFDNQMPNADPEQVNAFIQETVALYPKVHHNKPLPLSVRSMYGKEGRVLRQKEVSKNPVFQYFYGEIDDPGVNYFKTVFFMSHSLAQRRLWGESRNILLGLSDEFGAFAKIGERVAIKGGGSRDLPHVYSHEKAYIPFPNTKLGKVVGERELRRLNTASITQRNPKGDFEPIFVREDIADILNDVEHYTSNMPFAIFNAYHKAAKTVLSVQTHFRNLLSQIFMVGLQGHVPPFLPVGRGGVALRGANPLQRFRHKPVEAQRALKYLTSRNLTGGNLAARELQHAIEHGADMLDSSTVFRKFKSKVLNFLTDNRVSRLAQDFYISQDDAGKIYLFLSEEKAYANALSRVLTPSGHRKYTDGMVKRMAAEKAANVVEQTMQIYDKIPRAVQYVRDFPFVGPFVAFPSEIVRNVKNTLKLVASEIKDPELSRIGFRRLAGLLTVMGGVPAAIGAANEYWSNFDEKKITALKSSFLPFYMQNSQVVMKPQLENNKIDVFDFSFMDPFNYLRKPVIAYLRELGNGSEAAEAAWASAIEALDPVISPEIFWGELATAQMQLSRKEQSTLNDKMKTVFYRLYRAMAPGTVITGERILRSIGQPGVKNVLPKTTPYGREYKFANEAVAIVGPRQMGINLSQSIQSHARNYMSGVRTATTVYKMEAAKKDKSLHRIQKAREESLSIYQKSAQEVIQHIENARTLGVPESVIFYNLTRGGGGIGHRDARFLMAGKVPRATNLYKSY